MNVQMKWNEENVWAKCVCLSNFPLKMDENQQNSLNQFFFRSFFLSFLFFSQLYGRMEISSMFRFEWSFWLHLDGQVLIKFSLLFFSLVPETRSELSHSHFNIWLSWHVFFHHQRWCTKQPVISFIQYQSKPKQTFIHSSSSCSVPLKEIQFFFIFLFISANCVIWSSFIRLLYFMS